MMGRDTIFFASIKITCGVYGAASGFSFAQGVQEGGRKDKNSVDECMGQMHAPLLMV